MLSLSCQSTPSQPFIFLLSNLYFSLSFSLSRTYSYFLSLSLPTCLFICNEGSLAIQQTLSIEISSGLLNNITIISSQLAEAVAKTQHINVSNVAIISLQTASGTLIANGSANASNFTSNTTFLFRRDNTKHFFERRGTLRKDDGTSLGMYTNTHSKPLANGVGGNRKDSIISYPIHSRQSRSLIESVTVLASLQVLLAPTLNVSSVSLQKRTLDTAIYSGSLLQALQNASNTPNAYISLAASVPSSYTIPLVGAYSAVPILSAVLIDAGNRAKLSWTNPNTSKVTTYVVRYRRSLTAALAAQLQGQFSNMEKSLSSIELMARISELYNALVPWNLLPQLDSSLMTVQLHACTSLNPFCQGGQSSLASAKGFDDMGSFSFCLCPDISYDVEVVGLTSCDSLASNSISLMLTHGASSLSQVSASANASCVQVQWSGGTGSE